MSGANLIDSLAPGHWLDVPNSHMEAVFPNMKVCNCRMIDGPWAVMGSWGGATLDTKRNRLLVWGGGHADYGGNEVYAFDLNTLKWLRLTDPSVATGYYVNVPNVGIRLAPDATLGIMPDGNPASRHTYEGLAYIPPPIDKMFAAGGADFPTGGSDRFAWLFNPVSNTWKQSSNSQNLDLSGYGSVAAYDPATQHVWYINANGPIKEYDPETDSWIAHSGVNHANIYHVGAIDPDNREFVTLDTHHGNIRVWPLHNGQIDYSILTTSGDQTIQKAYYPGFTWDSDAKVFVGWDGGANVYTLDPKNWTWAVHVPAASNTVVPTAATKHGIFGRWQYVPSMGVFVGVNNTNEDVYIYKPDFGPNVSSSSSGNCRQTAVTSAASATTTTNASFNYQITGSNSPTYFSATGLPKGVTVNTSTGVISGTPTVTGAYTVSLVVANNCSQATATLNFAVTAAASPPPPTQTSPPTLTLSASPTSVTAGQHTILAWSSTNATSCTATGSWSGSKDTNGTASVSPTSDTTYTMTCTGDGGSVTRSTAVTVTQPLQPTTFSISSISTQAPFAQTNDCPSMLQQGESCTVSVNFNPQDATRQQGYLLIKTSAGDQTVSLTGMGASQAASAPTLSLSASSTSITSGGATTLSWTSTNAISCTASGGWSGSKATSGGVSVSPTADTIYTLTCTGAAGSVSRSVSIAVQASTTVPPGAKVTSFTLTPSITGSVPFTVGLAFKEGDIPDTPVLSIPGAQVIVKRRWNDGSVKMAIASGEVQLTANTPKTITVSNGSPTSGTNLTAADIKAAKPTATVSLGSYGTVHLADLLSSPFSIWISGPEMIEAHYRATVGSNPGMVVWFYVRLYKSGKLWVRTAVENGYLDTPSGQPAPKQDYTYIPKVTIGGPTVYDNGGASLTQYHNTRWTQTGWIGTPDPELIPHFNTAYLMATKLVPNYIVDTPSDSKLNNLYQTYMPYQHGGLTVKMGNAGYQNQIGLLPNWDALYLTSSGDARAYRSVLANAEALGSYGIVWTSSKTDLPPLPTDYPYWTVDGNKQGGEGQIGTGSLVWEIAHHPSEGYLAYLLTGDYYFLGTMEDQTALCYFMPSYLYGHGSGLNKRFLGQTRGQAWCDRTAGQLAAIGPTDDSFVSEFREVLANEAAHWLSVIQQPGVSLIGYIFANEVQTNAYGTGKAAPWQQHFWVATYGYVSDMQPLADMSMWNAVRDFMYKSIVGILGPGGPDNFCYTHASNYTIKISDVAVDDPTRWYDSWRKVYTETFGTDTTCGDTLLGSSGGVPEAAYNGYWGNLMPAITYAVDDGAPGALAAWSRLTHATNWNTVLNSGFGNTPVWGVVPRTTGYTAATTPEPPLGPTARSGFAQSSGTHVASIKPTVSTSFHALASSLTAALSSLVPGAYAAESSFMVSPVSIDFGTVAVGQTSAPKTVTITYANPSSNSSSRGSSSTSGNGSSALPAFSKFPNLNPSHSSFTPSGTSGLSGVFTHAIYPGVFSPAVAHLQQLLNSDPATRVAATGPGSPGHETNYYGPLTEAAVKRFQAKYGIVSSGTPATTGYGAVGPKTLEKLQAVFGTRSAGHNTK